MTVSDGITITVSANSWSNGTACERCGRWRATSRMGRGRERTPAMSAGPRAVVAFPASAGGWVAGGLYERKGQPGARGERTVRGRVERRAGAGRDEPAEVPQRGGHSPPRAPVRIGRRLRLGAIGAAEQAG